MIGICELTHFECELRESHLYPKFAYRMMKKQGGELFRSVTTPNLILRDGLKKNLLSSKAEEMFSSRETWFAHNMFIPYYENESFLRTNIKYDERFYYFAISLLWRLLLITISESNNNDLIDKYHLLEVKEEWRLFLLKGIYPNKYNKIYFFPLHNTIYDRTTKYSEYYFDRLFDSTFVWDDDGIRSSFYCKLPRYAFWAAITDTNIPTNYGIEINPIGGNIDFEKEFVYDKIISNYGITQFYRGRILSTNKIIEDSKISNSQQEKIKQRIESNSKFPNSELDSLLRR